MLHYLMFDSNPEFTTFLAINNVAPTLLRNPKLTLNNQNI